MPRGDAACFPELLVFLEPNWTSDGNTNLKGLYSTIYSLLFVYNQAFRIFELIPGGLCVAAITTVAAEECWSFYEGCVMRDLEIWGW